MKKIFVLGSLNYDIVIGAARYPKSGETIDGFGFMTNCGGKGANQAVACAKAGCQTYMIGRVGDDSIAVQQLENLKIFGVNSEFVFESKGVPSGTAIITVIDGDNRIILDCGANGTLRTEDVDRAFAEAREGDVLVTQFEIPKDTVLYGLKRAKELGMTTIVNPAPAGQVSEQLLALTDYIVPNEYELALIADETDEKKAVSKLLEMGVGNVLVTLGERGAAFYDGTHRYFAKAYPVQAVDTTAAGDTFIGYFAAAFAEGMTVPEAMKLACAASSLTVQKKGAQDSVPMRTDAEAALRRYEA